MARLSIRIDLDATGGTRLGPGKVLLLERIAEHGSIAAAGRSMQMSYRRAWELVAATSAAFGAPLVAARMGGRRGGGAVLTELGRALVQQYRAIEVEAAAAVAARLDALAASIRPAAGEGEQPPATAGSGSSGSRG